VADQDAIQEMIREGVEAARAGDKEKARRLFQQVTEQDMNNERGWLWLATVTDDLEEKRVYIENVLYINPDKRPCPAATAGSRAAGREKFVISGWWRR
jgi:thioredoxin-like negative regulator of GroEL